MHSYSMNGAHTLIMTSLRSLHAPPSDTHWLNTFDSSTIPNSLKQLLSHLHIASFYLCLHSSQPNPKHFYVWRCCWVWQKISFVSPLQSLWWCFCMLFCWCWSLHGGILGFPGWPKWIVASHTLSLRGWLQQQWIRVLGMFHVWRMSERFWWLYWGFVCRWDDLCMFFLLDPVRIW